MTTQNQSNKNADNLSDQKQDKSINSGTKQNQHQQDLNQGGNKQYGQQDKQQQQK